MERAEYMGILTSLTTMLGVDPAQISVASDQVFTQLNESEAIGDFKQSDILRRTRRTLELLRTRHPALQPDSKAGGSIWHSKLSLEQVLQRQLGVIKNTLSVLAIFMIDSMDYPERVIRRILFGRSETIAEEHITLNGFMISEKCLGGCHRTCAISAKGTDPQMPWELFDAATSSNQILVGLNQPVQLGDGEVLIYSQGGKKLFDVIERLVRVHGCRVEFTTAGLIPPNRESGIESFDSLSKLGPYASDVRITLSFNFLFGFIRTPEDVERYLRCVEETIDRIAQTGCNFGTIILSTATDSQQISEAYERLISRFQSIRRPSGPEERYCISKIGFADGSGEGTAESGVCRFIDDNPRHMLRSDGSLTSACGGFGARGSRIGNLLVNDLSQIRRLQSEHDGRFRSEVLLKGKWHCRLHQGWKNGRVTAPPASKPMLRIR